MKTTPKNKKRCYICGQKALPGSDVCKDCHEVFRSPILKEKPIANKD
jgi:hypothetical protein